MRGVLLLLAAAFVTPGQVRVVVSSAAGDRLTEKPKLVFSRVPPKGVPVIRIDPAKRYQKMDGFGATLNEAGLVTLNSLPDAEQEKVLQSLFDSERGAGFSLVKAPLAACDFASAGLWYTYDDIPDDRELKYFSIKRDLGPNGQLTFIKRARKYGKFAIQGTTDYPPDWMLEKEVLTKENYPVFAQYLVRYVQEYRKNGVEIDYLAPFNEPEFIYCKIKYDQVGELIRDHIAPAFEKAGLKTRLQAIESDNRERGLQNLPRLLADEKTRRAVATLTVHGYQWDSQGSTAIAKLKALYPEIPVWMTEVCYFKLGDKKPMPVWGFADGERWGRMLVDDMRNGASGWIYWNMILNQEGGPWLVSEEHQDPDDNSQHPVAIIDTNKKAVTYTGLYYYLAHFSKFVRPGAVRVDANSPVRGLDYVAFVNADGWRVLEVVNPSATARRFVLQEGERAAAVVVPAHGIATLLWE